MSLKYVVLAAAFFSSSVMAEEWVSLEKADGAALFGEKCGMCHRATGMGTGILARRMSAELALLENRKDLKPEFIQTVVRSGFGVMFPISRGEVSDEQLQKLADYLTAADTSAAAGREAPEESAAAGREAPEEKAQ